MPRSSSAAANELLRELALAAADVSAQPSRVLPVAHDASHFLLRPRAVVTPSSADEVAAVLRTAHRHGIPVTMRSGGTSLSGQAVTEGLLVDVRRQFRRIEVLDAGRRVRVEPGATVRAVNTRLRRYGTRLGPDPASEFACTVGGVIANNSSGMLCGTTTNTYRTLESVELVLASGLRVDTGAADADARLRSAAPGVWRGLSELRDRIRSNPAWMREITRQFAIKNTMGYGLNAFVDHDEPAELLARLTVGSEGTLAVVTGATFATVPAPTHAATALLVFDDLHAATSALPRLVETGLAAIELLDAASLRVAAGDPGAPPLIRSIRATRHAALLVEHQQCDRSTLEAAVATTRAVVRGLPLTVGAEFTTEPATRAAYWAVRKGLYAAIAGARPSGTTAMLEDIAVPVESLAPTCHDLRGLFERYGYDDAVVFGHAKDGNVHFLLTERLDDPKRAREFADFTESLVDVVLGRGGTLKAEHGTGRMMAPFVERQYGPELYGVMRELKRLLDPHGVLNPGVLISDDPEAHLRHIKSAPTIDPEVDRCVECGYCEPVCPSRDLTLTPRQRIAARRELAAAEGRGDDALADELRSAFAYDGVETCAVDGMCATACPVFIDTGSLVRRLREETAGPVERIAWRGAATLWGPFTRTISSALTAAAHLPPALPDGVSRLARAGIGDERVPRYTGDLPGGGSRRRPRGEQVVSHADVVVFQSCTGSMFAPATPAGLGASPGLGAGAALIALCERAGLTVRVPDEIEGLCCGTPWSSKGMRAGRERMRARVLDALWRASEAGRIPVAVDASSCAEGLDALVRAAAPVGGESAPMASHADGLRVVDATVFAADHVLPRLPRVARVPSLVVHPTCSSERLGSTDALVRLANAVAEEVLVPDTWACCGFAGDRGMLHPELTASATAAEAAEVRAAAASAHASSNRTCELGMSRATGAPYEHVLEVLERCTR